jgi:hypothetical protein
VNMVFEELADFLFFSREKGGGGGGASKQVLLGLLSWERVNFNS